MQPDAKRYEPVEIEASGQRIAAALAGRGLQGIVVWDTLRDVLLGHVVARELGTLLSIATVDEGLISLDAGVSSGPLAIVADHFARPLDRVGILGVVANHGGNVVAVATTDGIQEP